MVVAPILVNLVSCAGRQDEGWVSSGDGLSLVDLFDVADTAWQVRSIDLGKPEARRYLGEGWGYDEKGRLRDAVWALGRRSSLNVFLSNPRTSGSISMCSGSGSMIWSRNRSW